MGWSVGGGFGIMGMKSNVTFCTFGSQLYTMMHNPDNLELLFTEIKYPIGRRS